MTENSVLKSQSSIKNAEYSFTTHPQCSISDEDLCYNIYYNGIYNSISFHWEGSMSKSSNPNIDKIDSILYYMSQRGSKGVRKYNLMATFRFENNFEQILNDMLKNNFIEIDKETDDEKMHHKENPNPLYKVTIDGKKELNNLFNKKYVIR